MSIVDNAVETMDKAIAEIAALRAENARLSEALIDATAHLAAAVSAYEKFVGRHNRCGCRDALFETRYGDFTKATERASAALKSCDSRAVSSERP